MRRRVFALCSLLSLLPCVVACALWVASHVEGINVDWGGWYLHALASDPPGQVTAREGRGQFFFARGTLIVFRRTQQSTMPEVAADELTARQPWSGTFFERVDLAPGVAYGPPPGVGVARRLGFSWESRTGRDPHTRYLEATIPLWAIALPPAILPAVWLAARLRRRRNHSAPGRCPACGYDLRATPDRCPECGVDATAATSATTSG